MEKTFFTEIDIPKYPWQIDYHSRIMFIGSCFSESIGQHLENIKFNIDINPFGILYNPSSIETSLKMLMECKLLVSDDLFEEQGIWNSFYHHSRFSNANKDSALAKMNNRITASHHFLKKADFLFITFGTAWIYELKSNGQVVSNCHKVSADKFKRFRLTPAEIVESYKELLSGLWKFNPNLKIVFTLSPIRHWKDGAVENQLSKSTLHVAIHRLIDGFMGDRCAYFPSYEIVMDELRDYRFYAEDMLHLGAIAIDHIFERFKNAFVSEEGKILSGKVLKIRKALEHKPFNKKSKEYEKFVLVTLKQIDELKNSYPYLNLNVEKEYLEEELSGIQD